MLVLQSLQKKVLCGFEKCLVSKVVFYIMLDVAWNSVVVVVLLGRF